MSHATQLRFVFVITSVVIASSACGADGSMGRSGQKAGNAVGSECAVMNLTQRCTSCGSGVQVCTSARRWGECTCSRETAMGTAGMGGGGAGSDDVDLGVVPAGNLDTSISFLWSESQSSGGTCEAGRYEGSFDGDYCFSVGGFGGSNYGPMLGGIDCGSASGNPIMGLAPGGGPGLVFDLTKSGNGEILMVNGGKFSGTTNGFIPFAAELANGKLDCSTGKFSADIVNGQYEYAGQTYEYEGLLTADYDKTTHTLINGHWEVWEPATFNMMGTGHMGATNWGAGTWTTTWVP